MTLIQNILAKRKVIVSDMYPDPLELPFLNRYCNKIMKFAITKNGNTLTISTLHRGTDIGFVAAVRYVKYLFDIGCLNYGRGEYDPYVVTIKLDEVDEVFPLEVTNYVADQMETLPRASVVHQIKDPNKMSDKEFVDTCNRMIKFWVEENASVASVGSLQRIFGIKFEWAKKIYDYVESQGYLKYYARRKVYKIVLKTNKNTQTRKKKEVK